MKGCPLKDGRFKCCAIDCPILTKFAMELIEKKLFDIEKEQVILKE